MGKLKKVLLLVVALCVMISIMSIAATATGDTDYPVANVTESTNDKDMDVVGFDSILGGDNVYGTVKPLPKWTFTAVDDSTAASNSPYSGWGCDYLVSMDGATDAYSIGLYGCYGGWENGLLVSFLNPVNVEAGQKLPLLGSMAQIPWTYQMIVDNVRTFDCGAYNLSPENVGKTLTVQLVIWDQDTYGSQGYIEHAVVVEEIEYTFTDYIPLVNNDTRYFYKSSGYDANSYTLDENGNLTQLVIAGPHFAPAVAQIGNNYYASLADAIAAATDGDTIELLANDNVSLTNGQEIEINKSLTINGNGFTIYGTPDQTGTNYIFITGSGTVSINGLNVEGFGYNRSTDPAHAPIYVSTGFTGTVNLSGVSISRFNRGGLFLYGGSFNVVDCDIDCANSRSGAFTKGIEIKGSASGTISNTTIYNMERPGSDSTAGIEIYGYGSVLVDGCTILSDVDEHQAVKATYGIVSSRVGEHDPSNGSLVVKDSFFVTTNACLSVADSDEYGPVNGYTMTVEDCDFNTYVATWSSSSSITIKSGSFCEDVYADAGTIYIEGGSFTNFAPDGNVVITGGTFDADPTAFVAEGYEAVNNGNGTWTVDKIKVAQIGTTKYTSLADAIAAANEMDGATVTLLRDYDMEANEPGYGWTTLSHSARENFLVISGNMTFDLGGHTLSNLFNNTFKITGNVTIQNGEMRVGQYTNGASCSYVMMTGENANLVINNLTTFGGINVSAANATINNLSFSGTTFYAVCSQDNAVVTINGGTYTKAITGAANYLFWVEDGSVMNITGGSFTKGTAKFNSGNKPVITGGTFDFDPTNNGVASGYEATDNGNGTWTVDQIKVAQIGETKYTSLQAAIAAAQAGDTIKLLANIDLTATVNIEKSLTIDLNGKNITATNARALWVKSGEVAITGTGTISATKTANGSFASSSSVIRVGNSGTAKAKLTIGTGVTVSTDYCYGVTVFGTNTNGVELVVNGNVTVTGTAAAISGNGNSGNKGNVTINTSAVVTATADAAIYHPQGDYLTINGGTITGPVAVYQKSGTMTINGGTFTATAEAAEYTPKGDGLTPTGDAIVIDNCGYPGGAPSAYISGATITSANGKQIGYYVNGTSAEGTVLADSAYTLNTNKDRAWTANTDSTYQYKIGEVTYVAQIGTTKYTSLEAAIDAAQNGDTIVLLADVTYGTDHVVDVWEKEFNLDLNSHTFTTNSNQSITASNNGYKATAICFGDYAVVNPHRVISISNGTIRTAYGAGIYADGDVVVTLSDLDVKQNYPTNVQTTDEYSTAIRLTTNANIVVVSGSYEGKYAIVVSNSGGIVTINGGTFRGDIFFSGSTSKEATKSITINGGNFAGTFVNTDKGTLVIKGGYFTVDPTAYVADGYSVVESDLEGYTYKVVPYVEQSTTNTTTTSEPVDNGNGTTTTTTTTTNLATAENGDNTQYVIKVETTTVTTSTSNPENPTEDTNTVYKPVTVDVTSGNDKATNVVVTNTSGATDVTDAKATVEAVTGQSSTFKAKVDESDASSANVLKTTAAANAIAKAAATVGAAGKTDDITDAKVILQTTLKSYTLAGTNNAVVATKVVYDIKPVAVIYKVEGNKATQLGDAVELDNADIKEGETFTFTIPVPENMTAETVKVSHIGTDGYSTEIGTYEVQGTGSNRYVTVTVDHFSKFELEATTVVIDGNCVISASISLKDSIDINFYVNNLKSGTNVSDYTVKYTFNGNETVVYGSDWTAVSSNSYKFVVASCAAKQINDTVTFEVLYKGETIKKIDSYSIRQYCVNKIDANSNQKLVELCRAVLDYGAAAQKYFNYNKANLANAGGYGLASKVTTVPGTYNIASASKASDVTSISASLSTLSKTEVNFYVATSNMISAQVTLNGDPVSNVVIGDGSDGVYKITVKGIEAANLKNVYVLKVTTTAGETTVTYSALAYTYSKQNTTTAGEISLAIYNYYLKADAYFG